MEKINISNVQSGIFVLSQLQKHVIREGQRTSAMPSSPSNGVSFCMLVSVISVSVGTLLMLPLPCVDVHRSGVL